MPSEPPYQERFSRQRGELMRHFEDGYNRVAVPRNLNGVVAGVGDYIRDHEFFRLTPDERRAISGNPDFNPSAVDGIETSAKKQAINDVIKVCRERISKES